MTSANVCRPYCGFESLSPNIRSTDSHLSYCLETVAGTSLGRTVIMRLSQKYRECRGGAHREFRMARPQAFSTRCLAMAGPIVVTQLGNPLRHRSQITQEPSDRIDSFALLRDVVWCEFESSNSELGQFW